MNGKYKQKNKNVNQITKLKNLIRLVYINNGMPIGCGFKTRSRKKKKFLFFSKLKITKKKQGKQVEKKFKQGVLGTFVAHQDLDWEGINKNLEDFDILLISEEIAPSTGNVHYHGVFRLKKKKKLAPMQKFFVKDKTKYEQLHICQVIDLNGCLKYVGKEGKIKVTKGDMSAVCVQGKRTDLDVVTEKLKLGTDLFTIMCENMGTYIKYYKGIKDVKFLMDQQERKSKGYIKMDVKVYYGDTGTGKTRRAVQESEDDYFILRKGNGSNIWFDGYMGQKTLIIDDFYGWICYSRMLTICDGYIDTAEIKGGTVTPQWRTIIITSNKAPELWWKYKNGVIPEFIRRCPKNKWVHFIKLAEDTDMLSSRLLEDEQVQSYVYRDKGKEKEPEVPDFNDVLKDLKLVESDPDEPDSPMEPPKNENILQGFGQDLQPSTK